MRATVGLPPEELDRLLIEAAKRGALDDAADAIGSGASPEAVDSLRQSAMHHAAKAGSADMVELLAGVGANASAPDSESVEPLASAVIAGSLPCVKALLAAGADPNCRDRWGAPMLHVAVCGGPEGRAILPALAKAGADLEAHDRHGFSPIHWAAVMGMPDAARDLVALGANPAATDAYGRLAWQTCGYDDPKLRGDFAALSQQGPSASDSPNPVTVAKPARLALERALRPTAD